MKSVLITALLFSQTALHAAELPDWAGRAPNGDAVRVAVTAPEDPRFHHLAWPKAVRAADGTLVLGYLMGRKHGGENCPAVSISTDGGKTFSAPKLLREFGKGRNYGYGWLVPMAGRRARLFYYHGQAAGPNSIWVLETEI